MLASGLPQVLLFDLDDTILRFTAGQPNFWELALLKHLPDRCDHALLFGTIARASDAFWAPAGWAACASADIASA